MDGEGGRKLHMLLHMYMYIHVYTCTCSHRCGVTYSEIIPPREMKADISCVTCTVSLTATSPYVGILN